MNRYISWFLLSVLLLSTSALAAAKSKDPAKYKVAEVKHFTTADGVSLPAEYLTGAYDSLREQLVKKGVVQTAVEDSGTISDADAADAVVLECKVVNFHGNGLAGGHVIFEVTLSSRAGHKPIQQFVTKEFDTNGGSWSHRGMVTGHYLVDQIMRNLK